MKTLFSQKEGFFITLGALVAVMAFAFDLSVPLGVAGGIPYVFLVLLGLWAPDKRDIVTLAAVGVVLTVIGYFLSPPDGVTWMVLTNRGLIVLAILASAFLCLRRKAAEEDLHRINELTEARVAERTSDLSREIAERRWTEDALRESERRFRDIAEAAGDWFWEIDAEGRFSYVSSRVADTLGLRPGHFHGKYIEGVLADKGRDESWDDVADALHSREPFRNLLCRMTAADGTSRDVRLSGTPVFGEENDFRGFRGSATDVTAELAAHRRMAVAEEQATRASRAKSEFLGNISHELRTPLNAIIGFSHIISSEVYGPVGNPRYKEYVDYINESGAHLLEIVNDILDLSNLDSGRIVLREDTVDIVRTIEATTKLVKARAEEAGINLQIQELDNLPQVTADGRRLRQVLVNLLSNAVKFTPRGGKVTVSAHRDADGSLVVTVADTGIGIAPESLSSVMEPFAQADNGMARRYQGAGLGLTLARDVIELHGGTIELDSTEGRGTRVSVRLPAGRVAA